METRQIIKDILTYLKNHKILPKNIQKTEYKSLYFYNIFDNPIGEFIFYNVATGIDSDENTAFLKALVEHFERISLSEANESNIFGANRTSDGYAAYPTAYPLYKDLARANAIAEATERYVWSYWWDKQSKLESKKIDLNSLDEPTCDLLKVIASERELSDIYELQPAVKNSAGIYTLILFAKIKNRGYLSGGAAGTSLQATRFRAASEIIRHHLAFSKFEKFNLTPTSFYENRLVYFAQGDGNIAVADRLATGTNEAIELPPLLYDKAVPFSHDSIVYAHRCYFENQPPFIGGNLERLCL